MNKLTFRWLGVAALMFCFSLRLLAQGDSVVVLYNRNLPESKKLADYYAARRAVPTNHLFGMDLSISETITREEFQDHLQKPFRRDLKASGLWSFSTKSDSTNVSSLPPSTSKVRYAVLCYGIPLRILNDPKHEEEEGEKLPAVLRRNEAAVDSELALLPISGAGYSLAGPFPNKVYGATNTDLLSPTNGVLMVARLDGPTVEIAKSLVDKALEAEARGLWGRAYFDARGLTNGNMLLGDELITGAAEVARKLGYETIVDNKDERFPVSFPMSSIAFYAGWYEYDGQVSGPFTRPTVEFMPGAFAYHLHSFSAATIRSPSHGWVGPLLAKGATATMGTVFEPFLGYTPNITMFFHRFIHSGFSYGEAAYAAQNCLSWQTTIVGDPLYCPFAKKPPVRHAELARARDKWIEWSHLKVVNINLATGLPIPELIQYLEQIPETSQSAVLLEKLGDLFHLRAKLPDAENAYKKALALSVSPQQRVRLALVIASVQELQGHLDQSYESLQDFPRKFPDYPDMTSIYRRLKSLAGQLNKTEDKERFQREVDRLASEVSSGSKE